MLGITYYVCACVLYPLCLQGSLCIAIRHAGHTGVSWHAVENCCVHLHSTMYVRYGLTYRTYVVCYALAHVGYAPYAVTYRG